MLNGLLPVGVFVANGCKDLIAMVAIHIADVCSEDAVSEQKI